ncbi:hypothetical protein DFH06DRAFT_1344897 [Mycena polygramma]|nr:hypothetical protein DFH06DRAFT_1344897 [Mycena polygramma]
MDRVPGRAISNTAHPVGSTPNNPFLVDENGHFGLTASTPENPFLVDENGNFVQKLRRSPPKTSTRRLRIYENPTSSTTKKKTPRIRGIGPPSMIRQDIPRMRVSRAAREEANDRPYLRAMARLSLPPTLATTPSAPVAGSSNAAAASGSNKHDKKKYRVGFRQPRMTPLSVNELYLTQARPPADSDALPHHECSVCFNIKSHPVAYGCGHSNCYVCVRQWLEHSWTCPVCSSPMREEPIVSGDSQRAIAFDHPSWEDHSIVTYSWEGLQFPGPVA